MWTREEIVKRVEQAAPRVAALGMWPAWISTTSLTERLPTQADSGTGFDAGIACALDLIPRDKQRLAAQLHAAYTPEAVEQVRREIASGLTLDHETTWWLAACSVCIEGQLDWQRFSYQIDQFRQMDEHELVEAAEYELNQMRRRYSMRKGIAFALVDGGMQGAYIDGHDIAASYAADLNLYFLGTFHESLGLEDFAWKELGEPEAVEREKRLGRSGPVHGSKQFVKCADQEEFERACEKAREFLRLQKEQQELAERREQAQRDLSERSFDQGIW